MFLLDTNVVIAVMNGRKPEISTRLKLEMRLHTLILISTVVLYELNFGIAKSNRRQQSVDALTQFLSGPIEIAPFTVDDAGHAGEIRGHLAQIGSPIGTYDIMLAAQARCRSAMLVTANTAEFSRVPGLRFADWS